MKLRQLLLGGVHRFGVIENEKNPAATYASGVADLADFLTPESLTLR